VAGRTIAIGDVHGELAQLKVLLARLPLLDPSDTLVFLGDYVDRGPHSMQVVNFVRFELPQLTPARVVALRGNHEDAWLKVAGKGGWAEFVRHKSNGCLATLRSYRGLPCRPSDEPTDEELEALASASFLPPDVLSWFDALPHWYEDEHAIYVHAGLPRKKKVFQHPSDVRDERLLLWVRTMEFFTEYRGKRVVVGHTVTSCLPQEYSSYTPEDPTDLWAGECVVAIDTGAGKGGFLTGVELPAAHVYEARNPPGGAAQPPASVPPPPTKRSA
jgi:serine/threonine protein phosphatase 1